MHLQDTGIRLLHQVTLRWSFELNESTAAGNERIRGIDILHIVNDFCSKYLNKCSDETC